MKTTAVVVALFLCSGCSLIDLTDLELARCNNDTDCEVFADPGGDGCEVFVCSAESGQCVARTLDADGDGDPSLACGGMDCDDADPAISSTATEICDGLDNDCNGLLDGPDEDNDADGSPDLCAGPLVAEDCDDDDPFTFLGAPELCDGLDNDCQLGGVPRVTGGRQPEPTEDADGDAYAADDDVCTEMTGDPRFIPKGDCDDSDPTVFAMATELCDGIDNDCDGIPDNLAGGTTPGEACLPIDVEAGRDHTCVRRRDKTVVCWGSNGSGQIGDSRKPGDTAMVVGISDVEQLAGGGTFTCARTSNGDVFCWGSTSVLEAAFSFNWRTGFGQVRGISNATHIDAGGDHACAVVDGGEVRCWGFPCPGQPLNGSLRDCDASYLAVTVPGVTDAVQVAANGGDTCITHATGEVTCMGFNIFDRLGIGAANTIGKVPGVSTATAVAFGGNPCALLADGSVSCWGVAADGMTPLPPTPVSGLAGVEQLVGGGIHACARLSDGSLSCWGRNGEGQLGVGDDADRDTPTMVSGVMDATDVSAGGRHTCAVRADGVYCWGRGAEYQLGDGRTDHPAFGPFWSVTPLRTSVTANARQITGDDDGTCFRMPNLEVRCAGADTWGELGGPSGFDSIPTRRLSFADVVDVALGGGEHMCLVRTGGSVHCFGRGRRGETGTTGAEGVVMGVDSASRVVAGRDHSCALKTDGSVLCWGANERGQLGSGSSGSDCGMTQPTCSRTPLSVSLPGAVMGLSAGRSHTCAIVEGGLFCWGDNESGQLGRGSPQFSTAALEVAGLPADDPPALVAASSATTCVALASGSVWCWGRELSGSMTSGSSPAPTEVPGISGVVQLAMTSGSACARVASGVVRCWGDNTSGQLGNGSTTGTALPADVVSLDDAQDIGCGERHCCATRTSGQSVCWGAGGRGQLGSNSMPAIQTTPISTASMLL